MVNVQTCHSESFAHTISTTLIDRSHYKYSSFVNSSLYSSISACKHIYTDGTLLLTLRDQDQRSEFSLTLKKNKQT